MMSEAAIIRKMAAPASGMGHATVFVPQKILYFWRLEQNKSQIQYMQFLFVPPIMITSDNNRLGEEGK